ncbi:MAG: helix-turn-helix transcriptional regulator [Clostridia bacterium]|nr:helix-turn-helix transcriptional regulator [Clostridia bacterium]
MAPSDENSSTENAENEEAQKKNSISADLIRGHINTIILRTLYESDRYGYDIINEIEQKSHGQYSLKQPTLYSALKRLETQGYVRAYWGGVSNGGRRRYFSLTEEGRKVAEKNQAEWEYSRTIIDSLISQNDFDFSQPAPDKLDFRILRQATSRTPIVHEVEESPSAIPEAPVLPIEPTAQPVQENIAPQENIVTQPIENTEDKGSIPLFLTRSEEERNYKDILSKLYQKTIKTQTTEEAPAAVALEEPQTAPPTPVLPTDTNVPPAPVNNVQPEEEVVRYEEITVPFSSTKINFQDVEEQARYDGLRIWTAGGAVQKKDLPENFFNKGLTLLKASLIFFAVAMAETFLAVIFREKLQLELWYLITMLVIACVPPAVCGALCFAKYRPCCKRLKNNSSIYNGIILFITTFILLVAVDLIADIKFTDGISAITYLLIPFVYLLNIIVFAVSYYLLSRSKV